MVMDEEFPSNSRGSGRDHLEAKVDKEDKKLEQVTTGKVIQRKKSWSTKFKETFISGPSVGNVFEYVMYEIVIPAGKDLFLDATNAGLQRKFYGEASGRRGYGRSERVGYTAYNRIGSSDPRRSVIRDDVPSPSRRARATHDFGEIVLESRAEAMTVIDMLNEILSKFEMARVADLYELVGEESHYTDQRWGWTDLRGADIQRVRDGYLLILPKTEPLN